MAKPQWWYSIRNAFSHSMAYLVLWIVRILPGPMAYGLGKLLALGAWWIMGNWRHTSRTNLKLIFGDEITAREREEIGRQSAIHMGYYAIEFIRMGFVPVDKVLDWVVETEGIEYYNEALKEGKGVIGLAMHYGNWDLSGAYLSTNIRQLHAVGKIQRDPFFTDLAFPRRARFGIENIYSGKRANSAILKTLKENKILGLLADQNGGSTGLFAPMAGHLASTVPGPAALSLKTGAPMLVTYTKRIAPGKHRFIVKPPLDMSNLPEGKEERMIEVLARVNQAYLDVIREDPSQWLLGHKRWKTRPKGEKWLY